MWAVTKITMYVLLIFRKVSLYTVSTQHKGISRLLAVTDSSKKDGELD